MNFPGRASAFVLVLTTSSSAGAVPLLTGFGGPDGYGTVDHCVHPTDNGSYAGSDVGADAAPVAIDLRVAFPDGFPLFGRSYPSFYLNANGNITFTAPLASPDAVAYPVVDQPMVAPWWADVDTRGGGQPSANAICYHLEANRLVVTWHDVQRHGATDGRVNDFQMILGTNGTCTRKGGDVDFEYRYNRCGWAAGEGGTFAQIGFDAGNRMNFVALPESRSASITSVCDHSNVSGGAPGLYRFQIRGSGIGAGCSGAGLPCTVDGALGSCAAGVTVCAGLGVACARLRNPDVARCNGLDNDCDGAIDEGPALCGDGRTCERGYCRARCGDGGPCPTGQTCSTRGTCEETACIEVECPGGQRCTQGVCVDACDGVACPTGARCILGQCADPCERVTCEARDACDQNPHSPTFGQCVAPCQCAACPLGSVCRADGRCVEEGCEDVTCPSGTVCAAGVCRDPCTAPAGVRLCLDDQECRAGRCVPGRDGGVVESDVAVADVVDATDIASAVDVVDAEAVDGGRVDRAMTLPGCGCRAAGGRAGGVGWAWAGVALGLAGVRRRRAG